MINIENFIEKQPNVKSLLLQIGEIAEQKEKERADIEKAKRSK